MGERRVRNWSISGSTRTGTAEDKMGGDFGLCKLLVWCVRLSLCLFIFFLEFCWYLGLECCRVIGHIQDTANTLYQTRGRWSNISSTQQCPQQSLMKPSGHFTQIALANPFSAWVKAIPMCLHTLSQNACVRTQHNHHKNPCYLKWSSPGIYKWVSHKQSNLDLFACWPILQKLKYQ